jgi:hypothetical protein
VASVFWVKVKRWLVIALILLAIGYVATVTVFWTWLFFATYELQGG